MKVTVQDMGGGHEMLQIDNEAGEVWCIPFSAIASWGQLLGLTDQEEIVEFIMNYKDDGTEWGPLYETLWENLDELSRAGVPAEYMADLVDPNVPSPIPGPKAQKRLRDRRGSAQGRMKKKFRKDAPKVSEFRQSLREVLDSRQDHITKRTNEFMDQNSPEYIVHFESEKVEASTEPPAPAPAPAVANESVEAMQIHLTSIDPSSI